MTYAAHNSRRLGPREITFTAIVVAASLTIGIGSAWWSVRSTGGPNEVANGPWVTAGIVSGDDGGSSYMRARIAMDALMGVDRGQIITYLAKSDSAGNALDGRCTYKIMARDAPARWYTLTVYDGAGNLIANDANRYYFSNRTLERDQTAFWTVHVSPTEVAPNWLPTGKASSLQLAYRLFNPMSDAIANPASIVLPTITREACP